MRAAKLLFVSLMAVGLLACESRTDRTDGGGVILSISDFDGLPIFVSVNSTTGFVQVGETDGLFWEDANQAGDANNWFYDVRAINACGQEP